MSGLPSLQTKLSTTSWKYLVVKLMEKLSCLLEAYLKKSEDTKPFASSLKILCYEF